MGKCKRKVAESLVIREKQSPLNTLEMLIPLNLFYILYGNVRESSVSSVFATLGSQRLILTKCLPVNSINCNPIVSCY